MLLSLPDNVLLMILYYLNITDLSRMSRVCIRCWKLVHDKTLWENIDATIFPINLQQLWKLMRTHFTSSLKSLKIRGFAKTYSGTPRWKAESVSSSFLLELSKRSPALKALYLQEMYFPEKINITQVPLSVTKLSLSGSHFSSSQSWFTNNKELHRLTYLDLSKCSSITQKAFLSIFKITTIEVLCLRDCYNVNNNTIKLLVQSLVNLQNLDIRGTNVTDTALFLIGQFCNSLCKLQVGGIVGNCSSKSKIQSITDRGVCDLRNKIENFINLNLSNTSVTDETLDFLEKFCPDLQVLNMINTLVTQERILQLKNKLVHCKVIWEE